MLEIPYYVWLMLNDSSLVLIYESGYEFWELEGRIRTFFFFFEVTQNE